MCPISCDLKGRTRQDIKPGYSLVRHILPAINIFENKRTKIRQNAEKSLAGQSFYKRLNVNLSGVQYRNAKVFAAKHQRKLCTAEYDAVAGFIFDKVITECNHFCLLFGNDNTVFQFGEK